MKYVSTRGSTPIGLDEALVKGIADDSGLFVPVKLPDFTAGDFGRAKNLTDVAAIMLAPFFVGSSLKPDLSAVLAETFYFPIPITPVSGAAGQAKLLELFHGPTSAFKDVGAGFLAACLSRLESDDDSPLTILVATSGDTGGAVAAAFDERPGM